MSYSAVCLLSGGLDSILACEIVKRQGIEILPVWISTCFQKPYINMLKKGKDRKWLEGEFRKKTGYKVKVLSIQEEFFRIMHHPEHGFGKNLNPCIDCKIAMLKKAKSYMYQKEADFIVTGEVLDQRPMSQNIHSLKLIEHEAGVTQLLLRPLSAKLLHPTAAEEDGVIDRDVLYDLRGRTRKPQMELAEEFGITDYPQPAGGCLLTDPQYYRGTHGNRPPLPCCQETAPYIRKVP
jgi:tRNA U34 2-thiouridine synthase MnmA/TrmU